MTLTPTPRRLLQLRDQEFTTEEVVIINERLQGKLLTTKPVVYLANCSEKSLLSKKSKCKPQHLISSATCCLSTTAVQNRSCRQNSVHSSVHSY